MRRQYVWLMIAGLCAFPLGASTDKADITYENVSVSDAHELWLGGIFNLDVRTTSEFSSGHIPGAWNISVTDLPNRLADVMGHQHDPILVNCGSGSRSVTASQLLAQNGFTDVHNMLSGFSAWKAAGYEIATGSEGEGEGEFAWGDLTSASVACNGLPGGQDAVLVLQWYADLIDALRACPDGMEYARPAFPPGADVNADGKVGGQDAALILKFYAGVIACIPADRNCDGSGPEK